MVEVVRAKFARIVTTMAIVACGLSAAAAQTAPAGQFVVDRDSGCKVWNPHPMPGESAVWAGACRDGFADGTGQLHWIRDGKPIERDEGEWRQGRQEGRGSQDWISGRYDGDLVAGEPEGQGVLSLRSGRFEGGFSAGKPNGAGTLVSLEGSFRGIWKDGCLVGDKRHIAVGVSSSLCR